MRLRSTRLTAVAAAVQKTITTDAPAKLFKQGEQGVWYDPSDFNRYMQTGEELVSDGTFANNGLGWGIGSDVGGVVSFSNNEATLTNSTGTPRISSAVAFIPGRRYVLTFDQTGSNNSVYSSGSEVVGTFGPGSNRIVFTATANSINIGFRNFVTGTSFSIRNVSIKELTAIPTATLFQDFGGTTPVTAVEQPVGLMLDKRLGLVRGDELAPGLTPANWIVSGTDATHIVTWQGGGGFRFQSDTTSPQLVIQAVGRLTVGKMYEFVVTVLSHTSGQIKTDSLARAFAIPASAGTHRFIGTAIVTAIQVTRSTTNVDLTVSSISVRELPGNHAFQATTTNRPILGVHPNSGTRNILHGSASTASTVYWLNNYMQNGITSTKVNHGVDVDGLPFCDYRFTGTATNNFVDAIYSNFLARTSATPGQSFTLSAICRRLAGTEPAGAGLRLGVVEETAPDTYIGITTNPDTISGVQEALYSATRTISTGNQVRIAFVVSLMTGETIDVTYRIKAAQLEAGASRSNYQFNYSPLNITEPGIPGNYYLRCDGIDDGMQTNNIDYASTDKVTVFAGVRKLSDAASGMLAELSDGGATRIGVFSLITPAIGGTVSYRFTSKGDGTQANAGTGVFAPAPDSAVLTCVGNISGDVARLSRNGVVIETGTVDQGFGNYTSHPLYLFRRAGTSVPFNGNFYGLVIRGALSSTNEIIDTEAYMAVKTGFTAPVIEQSPIIEVLP